MHLSCTPETNLYARQGAVRFTMSHVSTFRVVALKRTSSLTLADIGSVFWPIKTVDPAQKLLTIVESEKKLFHFVLKSRGSTYLRTILPKWRLRLALKSQNLKSDKLRTHAAYGFSLPRKLRRAVLLDLVARMALPAALPIYA